MLIKNLPSEHLESNRVKISGIDLNAIFIAFSCSAISLALEIILARLGLRALGNSAIASTITITVFLLGSAAGACLLQTGRAQNLRSKVIKIAPVAILLAAAGLALSNQFLNSWPELCFALLLPSFSSSALISALSANKGAANNIYLAGNSGAWCGVVLAGFALLPTTGITASLAILSLAAIPAACLAFHASVSSQDQEEIEFRRQFDFFSAAVLFLSALGLMILEFSWIRFDCLILGSSSQAISATIASVIGGLTLGNALSIKLARPRNLAALKAIALSLSALTCILSLKSVTILPQIFQYLRLLLIATPEAWQFFLPRLAGAALLSFPASLSLGLLYPLYTNNLSKQDWKKAYFCSSAGAVLGPLVFALALHELHLYESALVTVMCLTSLLMAAISVAGTVQLIKYKKKMGPLSFTCAVLSLVTLALAVVSPQFNVQKVISGLAYFPPSEDAVKQVKLELQYQPLLFYKDGANSTISVEQNKLNNVLILKSDGKVEATIPVNLQEPAAGSDLPTQSMLALLPAMVHGGKDLKCLIIGQGSGTTSGVAASLPTVSEVQVVELEPAVIEAATLFPYGKENKKIRLTEADGRTFLRRHNGFDLIISQPAEPWVGGSCGLYTKEFFQLARAKLRPEGLFTQWLQLYGLSEGELLCALKTFASVFPHSLVFHQSAAGEIILVGAKEKFADERVKNRRSMKLFFTSEFRRKLSAANIHSWQSFCANQILSSRDLDLLLSQSGHQPIEINTDDNLLLEYGKGRYLNNTEQSQARLMKRNLALLTGQETSVNAQASVKENLDLELATDPLSCYFLNRKASLLIAGGKVDQARNLLLQSNSLNPSSVVTHELLALAQAASGQLNQALHEIQIAHQLNTGGWRPYFLASCIYQEMGKGEEAAANLNKAGQICPDNAILNYNGLAQNDKKADVQSRTGSPTGTLKSNLTRLLQIVGE